MSNYAYLRVSHLESLNGTSFETQERRIRNYAELNDFQINFVHSEVVSGGVDFKKRKVFQKILKQLKRGDRLVVSRLDRLVRNILFTLQFVEHCKKIGAEVHICDLGNCTGDGLGRIFLNILSCLAETERLQISERIKASKAFAKKDRRYLGGFVEYGYKVDEKKQLIPDDKEFAVLQSMVNLRKSGLGYRKISDEIKNKFGKRIYYPQIHKILNRSHNKQFI